MISYWAKLLSSDGLKTVNVNFIDFYIHNIVTKLKTGLNVYKTKGTYVDSHMYGIIKII
jgi:hypothetical protein